MPQTTPERRARWPGGDVEACEYLEGRGFWLRPDFCWRMPTPDHKFTEKDKDAIIYLIEEWDFGPAVENEEGPCRSA